MLIIAVFRDYNCSKKDKKNAEINSAFLNHFSENTEFVNHQSSRCKS
jgi:hypothetical protein